MENLNKYYNNFPGDEFTILGKDYTVKNVLGLDKLEMTNGQIYQLTFSGSLVKV